ncbi:hypothetical protein O3G_MSEX006776 [Manduca sexta]|uniref:Endonuclease/exonuclease/phosphatase domain-containing protein n=1 Tax=Manduca sexta TaxID=7130 RepID=A0A921Z4Q0_MANSE|nr:hypothetical protein O3G_MSEX006776 [Manduca sexta]
MAVVAEPYFVPPRDSWVGDIDGSVTIITQGAAGSPPFAKVEKGQGYVAALLGGLWIVGVYFSPNRPLAEFESFLVRLGALVEQGQPHPAIVAGDFNATSVVWGSPVTNARGRVLEEWAISVGLAVLNRGSVDTCVRHNGGSIVDLSFGSPAVARRV